MCIPDNDNLKLRILQSQHDHPTARHLGRMKTLKMVQQKYHWKVVKVYVDGYVDRCHKYQSEDNLHKPYGLLKSLAVQDQPWSHITMDFIDQLPLSNGFDSIFVVVDHLTKMAVFINVTKKVTSVGLASLFIQHVFSKHGCPKDIVSDWGNKFILSSGRPSVTPSGSSRAYPTPTTHKQTARPSGYIKSSRCSSGCTLIKTKTTGIVCPPHRVCLQQLPPTQPFFANKGFIQPNPRNQPHTQHQGSTESNWRGSRRSMNMQSGRSSRPRKSTRDT